METQPSEGTSASVCQTPKTIAVSISESPDMAVRGFGLAHLNNAMVEIGRFLLASGHRLAYGGDLRDEASFTQTLFELARDQFMREPAQAFTNYFAWPIHLGLSREDKLKNRNSSKLVCLPAPDPELDPNEFLTPNSPENLAVWARSLTLMRRRQTQDTDARIILGGRLRDFKGAYPGLIEEALVTLQVGKPLYLLGALGGCTGLVIDMIESESTPQQVRDSIGPHQSDTYAETIRVFNRDAAERDEFGGIDYEWLFSYFRSLRVADLNNGLDEADNRRLFRVTDIHESIDLVLKGLKQLTP